MVGYEVPGSTVQVPSSPTCGPSATVFACLAKVGSALAAIIAAATRATVPNNITRLTMRNPFRSRAGLVSPAVSRNNGGKFDGSQGQVQLPRTPLGRSSQNPPSTHSGE